MHLMHDTTTSLLDLSICKTDNTVFSGEEQLHFFSETPGGDGT